MAEPQPALPSLTENHLPGLSTDETEGTRVESETHDAAATCTWIERTDELEHTHSEETVKPQSLSASRSTTMAFSTVVLRQRDVSQGIRGSGGPAEYELGRRLGEGGMGAVYQARQGAIDRTVAIKVIKPGLQNAEDLQDKFVAEAIITGDLEHPGIVPIYDLGTNAAGDVFYAMKEVRGQSWKQVIDQYSEAENIDVLLRVADAIAFAHARGIVHRDLKPDNVMIGEFGEVLVMDWGLALPTPEFAKKGVAFARGPAGTPAYMAPEMAVGDMDLIGPASDIYLLGALLFRILTGKAPHTGKHAMACLQAAERNEFVPVERHDELLAIALHAMALKPGDRYGSVKAFQVAIREHHAHAESLRLTDLAESDCQAAIAQHEYRRFEDSIAAFRNARRLWADNERAQVGLIAAQFAYATSAFGRGDLDLASQQLDVASPEHAALLQSIRKAQFERDAQRARTRRLKLLAIGLAASVLVVVSVASVLIRRSWKQEQLAHAEALQRFREAQTAIERLTGISQQLENFPRLQGVRQNLLEMTATYYHELNQQRSNDLDMQLATAQSLVRLGDVRRLLADHSAAQVAFESAAKLADPLSQASQRPDLHEAAMLVLSKSLTKQVECLRGQAKWADAEKVLGDGLRTLAAPQTPELHATLGDLLMQRAQLQRQRGRWSEAAKDVVLAQAEFDHAALGADPTLRKQSQVSLALSFDQLALVEEQGGHLEAAEAAARHAIQIWDALYGLEQDVPTYLEGLASSHALLGNIQRGFGRDAEPAARQSIKAYEALVIARPEVPHYQFNLATESVNLAFLLLQQGDVAKARAVAIEATQRCVRLANEYPENVEFADADASSRSVLGEVLRDGGELELAAGKLDEAIEHFAARTTDFREVAIYRERLAENLLLRAQVAELAARPDEGRALLERALAVLQKSNEASPTSTPSTRHGDLLGSLHLHLADEAWSRDEKQLAQTHYLAAVKQRESLPKSPELLHHFGWLLSFGLSPASRQPLKAVELFQQATASVAGTGPSKETQLGMPANGNYWFDLAVAQTQAGQWDHVPGSLEQAQKCRFTPRGQQQLVQSIVERHHGRVEVADQLLKQGSELLEQTSPGNPRLRRLRLLATP